MELIEIIEKNKEKFLEFNKIKYQRFQQFVSNTNTRKVINSISFLLSVNNKKFPGYVEGGVPAGIANYSPDEETKRFVKSKFPSASIEISEHRKPFIQMLAIMGSIGTIAYNKKSDFDYWVCIDRRETNPESFENFRKKVDAIQKWASNEIKLPVHMFINDVELVRKNIFAEDEEEAFGSTVGAVLKDEFFRSSIIISGKIPFWWVVPKQTKDSEYDSILRKLPPDIFEKDFVDLGNLYEISREDFVGAALFQIIKSLGNPFKSIIKIGLLEKYLSVTGDSSLMSQKIKINVHQGNFDDTVLDSYLNMFKEVYDFYSAQIKDKSLLDMLKKNLYLKIDPQLSRYLGVKETKNIPYKVVVMFQYAKAWKWNIEMITDLDNFDNWDFNKVMEFWDTVKKFMLLSYKKISEQFPALKLEKKVSETDFMLLSRKIKTNFKQEPDKIEQFITFKDTPSEAVLYIEPLSQSIDNIEWRLYKRNSVKSDKFVTTTLKVENNLLKLLAWTSLNQIYDPSFSRMTIQSGYARVNQQQVISFLDQSSGFFKEDRIVLKNEYFLGHAFNLLNFLIIDFNIEKSEDIQTVHFLYHTSWGESYLKAYNSEESIIDILYTILKDGCRLAKSFENYCAINTPDPYKKPYKRLISLFKEAYSVIVENKRKKSARFITNIGNKYVMFTRDQDRIEKDVYPNLYNLLAAVTLKPKEQIVYHFFSGDPVFNPLNALYNQNANNPIRVAFEEKGNFLIVYIINETGNFFTFINPLKRKEECLVSLYDFCQNVSGRVSKACDYSDISRGEIRISRIAVDRYGELSVDDETAIIKGKYVLSCDNKKSLMAAVSRHKGSETVYNIVFPDKVSSGFVSFNNLSGISVSIVQYQKRGIDVSTFISDLVFSDLKPNEISMGSTLYFLEKYKMESMFARGIRNR